MAKGWVRKNFGSVVKKNKDFKKKCRSKKMLGPNKIFVPKIYFGLVAGLVAGWLPGGRGWGVEGQLECLDIPYTSTNKVHLPLRPQISLYYTSPGGWSV